MKVTFKIPLWPPSTNNIYRNIRGKTLLSKPGRAFYRDAAHWIRTPDQMLNGPFHVELDYYPPTNHSFDVDNRIKACLDLLTKCGVWQDDKHVVAIGARKHSSRGAALVVITITELGDKSGVKQKSRNTEALETTGKVSIK